MVLSPVHLLMVVQVMTRLTIGGAANTLTYEGGVGADTIKLSGAVNSSTIYGDSSLQLMVVMIPSPLVVQLLVLTSMPTLVMTLFTLFQ